MSTTTVDRTVELMLQSGALMRGHFKLTSGLHSDEYCQCAKVLEHPEMAEELGRMLADMFRDETVDVVVSPAIGGIVIGHEVARALGVRSLFAERSETGMAFRRGFRIESSEKVLIIEDVVTTGKSTREVIAVLEAGGADVVGLASMVNRSGIANPFEPKPYRALLEASFPTWTAHECPLCRDGVPIAKPGSRPIKKS